MFKQLSNIFNIKTEKEFNEIAIQVFNYQYQNNNFYNRWVNQLNINSKNVKTIQQIPFLPIEFFKTKTIFCGNSNSANIVFTSSATTNAIPSSHYIKDISLYKNSFTNGFELFFGNPNQYVILALLPNYLSRKGSSLVYMFDDLIKQSKNKDSGFFLNEIENLITIINKYKNTNQKVLILGVTYALLDLCELNISLTDNFLVMETGGMKGNRPEMLKEELHYYLKTKFNISKIYSEYGMTELLSQAYCLGDVSFKSAPWMKFLIRDVNDPFYYLSNTKTGGINVIDLANINSCSFIATKDLGRLNKQNNLELLGRFDDSDIRGCNLLITKEN